MKSAATTTAPATHVARRDRDGPSERKITPATNAAKAKLPAA